MDRFIGFPLQMLIFSNEAIDICFIHMSHCTQRFNQMYKAFPWGT